MKRKVPRKKSGKAAVRRVHYVLSTHWDREWYQAFQDYRRRLVRLLDGVLKQIDAGKLRGPFTLDGQAILLEDYLEIRPQQRERIGRLVKSGMLKVGPWYVLPDEWLVSGEALIRNLELGRKIAREWGGVPSNAGFVCDLFGHISQLPQILAGFGITGGFLWRGLEPRATAHVLWKGADGTVLPCYRFGRAGYCDYTWDVRRSTEPNRAFDPATALLDLRAFLAKESDRTALNPILLFDGGDHLEPDSDHYALLFAQATDSGFPYEVVHSSLDDYLNDMLKDRKAITETVTGELREVARHSREKDQQWLIAGVLSSRIWIKQENAECQALLCQWAEPFACMASAFLGAEYPQSYLDTAWRWLLQNHPHDSICGCSIDQVHEDMKYRFAQCRQIAAAQIDESLHLLAAAVDGEPDGNEMRVLVANPLARDVDEPVDLVLRLPVEWGSYSEAFGFEPKPAFRLYEADGSELPYQLVGLVPRQTGRRVRPLKYPEMQKTNDVTVAVRLRIPALGYTTLLVREGGKSPRDGVIPPWTLPTRHAQAPSLATSERSMRNEFLEVAIESNGTLTVTDWRTRETYRRLLTFEDVADIGDGWFHGQAVNDQCIVSTAASAEIALVADGSQLCRFRIRTTLLLPRDFDFGRQMRSGERVPVQIESDVTLRAGCDRIEVCTRVKNVAKDHRLRVLFPTGANAQSYFADGAFDVIERRIGLPPDNHLNRELAVETTPQQSWTAVVGTKRGLAIISAGLPESAVRDQPDRPIALTLFRSTGKTVFTSGEPGGQLQGEMEFRYWIMPLARGIERRRLCLSGQQLAAGFRNVQLLTADIASHRGRRRIDPKGSLLTVEGEAVVTSVRQVQSEIQVRLFNPENTTQRVALRVLAWPKRAAVPIRVTPVSFEDKLIGPEASLCAKGSFTLFPKKIATLRFDRK
jgi:hypothetical protein